jgi:hypothetical protein
VFGNGRKGAIVGFWRATSAPVRSLGPKPFPNLDGLFEDRSALQHELLGLGFERGKPCVGSAVTGNEFGSIRW